MSRARLLLAWAVVRARQRLRSPFTWMVILGVAPIVHRLGEIEFPWNVWVTILVGSWWANGALLAADVVLRPEEGRPLPALPWTSRERAWATVLSHALAVVASTPALMSAVALGRQAYHGNATSPVALLGRAAEASLFGVVDTLCLLFAVTAPFTLRRGPPTGEIPRPNLVFLLVGLVSAAASVATGTTAAAAALALLWLLAPPWKEATSDTSSTATGRDDPGHTPLVGVAARRPAFGRMLRIAAVVTVVTVAAHELVEPVLTALAPLLDLDPTFRPERAPKIRLMIASLVVVPVVHVAASWHPSWRLIGLRGLADELARFQRHLPVAPSGLVDLAWQAFVRPLAVVVALVVAWLGATDGLTGQRLVLVAFASLLGGALAAGAAWAAMIVAVRRTTAPWSAATTMLGLVPSYLVFGLVLVDDRDRYVRGLSLAAAMVLALATPIWALARRRWST